MPRRADEDVIAKTIEGRRAAAARNQAVSISIGGTDLTLEPPWPSPADWRDVWIYFLLTDRFNNPRRAPAARWNAKHDFRQGGTFAGIEQELPHLRRLGARALWISPVLRNTAPESWAYGYTGYNTQDFLGVERRFASDGRRDTAERELERLVRAAHSEGMYVILDIVLNHAGRVFDYVRRGEVRDYFEDEALLHAPLGQEPSIRWIDGSGSARASWENSVGSDAAPDDAVWPEELQEVTFWRRRGGKRTDAPPEHGYIPGDFGTMRQLVAEYDASAPSRLATRRQHGVRPVLDVLVRCYTYAIARYDFDGFRIDTTKYLRPDIVEHFGNAIREAALSLGKRNFFTFGEIWESSEARLAQFVGRNSLGEGFGIDAAIDFPIQQKLRGIVKGIPQTPVEELHGVYAARKREERNLLSSHGEAGRFFVTFLDNHDQHERFAHPLTPDEQVTLALTLLFTLQGVPCVFYGTERGLTGTVDAAGEAELDAFESVREALWGMTDAAGHHVAFDEDGRFLVIQELSRIRDEHPALRYGRQYFRPVSTNGTDFGLSYGAGGVVAFSRILFDREVVLVANTSATSPWAGSVLVDLDLAFAASQRTVRFSNRRRSDAPPESVPVRLVDRARLWTDGAAVTAELPTAAVEVALQPMEAKVLV